MLGDDALACLKDIGKWLRLYDDKTNRHDVKRCLAEANVVQGDLLEILAQWPETEQASALRSKIAVQCLDLLRELTWPLVLEEDLATVNHHRHLPFLQLAQVGYKRAVLQHENAQILRTVIRIIVPIISMPKEDKGTRDWQVLNAALYFLRNIAIISQPQTLPSQGDENEVSRSTTIASFHQQDVLQLILTIASSVNEEYPHQDVVILELIFQLLKGIDPKNLFKDMSEFDKDRAKAFRGLLDKEKALLASSNKNASSRHHRFGQMVWLKRPDQKMTTLSGQKITLDQAKTMDAIDKSKAWNKPRTRGQKTEAIDETKDFAATVHIDESTRHILRSFIEDFLDSSFNPLFNSLRRAVSSEAERAKAYNARQYYYLMGWFLQAERARQEKIKRNQAKQSRPTDTTAEDSPFAYIAAVMTQENFVLLNRKMQQSLDDKEWSDLHACMNAFTEILHTVAAMSESSSDDDQDIAENIQARIFYEETTHDLVIAILRNYTNQGFGYLNSCTELASVFIRMLERYSKQNADLQIRSKRRARRKRKETAVARGEDDGAAAAEHSEPEADDQAQAQRTSSERRFDFNRYAVKFMTEPCINTFVRFTHYYVDLNAEQLKRAHRFFYRCAFKMERIIYLFRIDILHLFYRMIKGPDGLRKEGEYFKDWEELVKQVYKRCIKQVEERKELMVEMLFTKMPQTIFFLENGYDFVAEKRNPRPPAELIIKHGMTAEENLGVIVSVLVNQGKLDDIAWIKKILSNAADERDAWEEMERAQASIENDFNPNSAEPTDGTTEAAADPEIPPNDQQQEENSSQPTPSIPISKAPSITINSITPDRKAALYKDKYLRLLLKTLSFDRLGTPDDPLATWLIPSSLSPLSLRTSLDLIRKFEFDLPSFGEGVSAESLLRNKSAAGLHSRADKGSREASRANSVGEDGEGSSDDDGVGLSDIDELDERYGPGGPTARPASERPVKPARKRRLRRANADGNEELDEEDDKQKARDRKAREREKDAKIKSTIRVTDSDDEDDEKRDGEFFRLEEERRGRIRGVIRSTLLKRADEDDAAVAAAVEEGGNGEDENGGKGGGKKAKGRKRKSDVVASVHATKAAAAKKRKMAFMEESDSDVEMIHNTDNDNDNDNETSNLRQRDAPTALSSRVSSSEVDDSPASTTTTAAAAAADGDDTPLSSQPQPGAETSNPRGAIVVDEDEEEDDDVVVTKTVRRAAVGRGPFVIESDSDSDSER